jgi:SAM-dependent methyltransferase
MNDKATFLAAAGPLLSGRADRVRRFFNTFLSCPWLFDLVVRDRDFVDILNNQIKRDLRYLLSRLLQKTLWFWPRIIEAKMWTDGGPGKNQRPDSFLVFDTASKALCDAVARYASSKDQPILDLGCNVGRHLNDLHGRGFSNLVGVDAMKAALDCMMVEYPGMASAVELHHDLFQRFLRRQEDAGFDIVYSHGATIELVHPSFAVVSHLCRVTRNHVILILNEAHRTLYPRFWTYEFGRSGFFLREARRPVGAIPPSDPSEPTSLLVYSRWKFE